MVAPMISFSSLQSQLWLQGLLHQNCMQIYNKSNIHINNTSVSNGKFIKAQASNKINIDGTGEVITIRQSNTTAFNSSR